MARIGFIADGIDSGDRREGSAFPQTTPTATDAQGGIAGDFNNYQQNLSAKGQASGIANTLLFGFSIISASSTHPINGTARYNGGFCTSPLDTIVTPDNSDETSGDPVFYNPSSVDTASTTIARSHILDAVGNCTVYPTLTGTTDGTFWPDGFGIASPANIKLNHIRLLPKGNYAATFGLYDTSWGPTISGFSCNVNWATSQGVNLISTISSAGVSSAGSYVKFTITKPWAWIQFDFTGIGFNGTSNYFYQVVFDPVITRNPSPTTIHHIGSGSFSVTAEGNSTVTYQWQFSSNGGSTWSNLASGPPLFATGITSPTVTLLANTTSQNGWLFRCAVTDTQGTLNSLSALLTVT